MLTKADFQARLNAVIDRFPAVAARYRAGDPMVRMAIEAQFTGLSMLSQQLEVAQAEPFAKTRPATVLADAAMRGLIPKATPAVYRWQATNNNGTDFTIETGRKLVDALGRPCVVTQGVTIGAGATATFQVMQQQYEPLVHTVSGSSPFYAIEIPESDDDSYLAGIALQDDSDEYAYHVEYANLAVDQKGFHVEIDHRQRVYIKLGWEGVVGYQPGDGEELTVTISRSFGAVEPDVGTACAFENLLTPEDAYVDISMLELVSTGVDPLSITQLRELARYPSIYRSESVFLGQFEFLLRQRYPSLQFVSVWNEAVEEEYRGADIANMNCLFVACFNGNESTLTEADPADPVSPVSILSQDWSQTQNDLRETLRVADDSYRVKFFTPIRSIFSISIDAQVPTSYEAATVSAEIKDLLLRLYGASSDAARRGANRPSHNEVYEELKAVRAMDEAGARFSVSVDDAGEARRPELWRYVDASSISVTVTTRNALSSAWGR